MIRDVTERKVQEQALEDAREEAVRANAAKSRFLATMSHELRTPLNAIIGFSEMLANEEMMRLDQKRRHEYATLIGESGHHLLSVVNGILDMSKIESGNFEITPEPFQPAPVINTCCDLMALRARESGIDLICRVPEPSRHRRRQARHQADPDQPALQRDQVHAPRRQGRGDERSRGRIHVRSPWRTPASGSPRTTCVHVGDPFFQVRTAYDRTHDGTGLGLSIVKGLVELHGGELAIRSRVGVGTRAVAVRLPIDCEKVRRIESAKIERLPVSEPVERADRNQGEKTCLNAPLRSIPPNSDTTEACAACCAARSAAVRSTPSRCSSRWSRSARS